MGKIGGFVEWTRVVPKKRAIADRLRDWREVDGAAEPEEVRRQAGRCMDCGVPFCHRGCPLGNPIPEFADLVWKDRWAEAHRRLAETNEMPEMTGRLCPAPCEAACVLAMPPRDGAPLPEGAPAWGAPVTIEALEKAIAERAFAEGWVVPRPPRARTGRRVAVVGSGPAGLAAAARLNRAGHTVVVYEAAARAGGLLRYGIPDFKLEKRVIDRRLAVLEAEGVELRLGVAVGRDPTWDRLRAEHDALLIAIGAMRPRELDVPGRELAGVLLAMDYLADQNEAVHAQGPSPSPPAEPAGSPQPGATRAAPVHDARGQHVIILGGGDTGSDCLGTALRQGAASVTQIELMPAPPDARAPGNAWPAWPLVMRTSSSQEEGGAREFAFRTTHLEGEPGVPGSAAPGRLVALHGVRVELVDGRLVDIPGSALRLPCDRLILALGFTGPDAAPLVQQLGVALDDRRNVRVDGAFATTVPGVFCAGDAHRGASLIVWALAEGRDAAAAIDAYLRA